MDTQNLQSKIDGLRNQTIQNGCTHEKAHTARTLLTKLQTKLNLARQAQAQASYVASIHYTPTEADHILQEIRKQAQEKAQYEAHHPNTWTLRSAHPPDIILEYPPAGHRKVDEWHYAETRCAPGHGARRNSLTAATQDFRL